MSSTIQNKTMDTLDLLEERIVALEKKILPSTINENETQSAVDFLLQVKTMLATALSCRDIISSIINSVETLNEWLDPFAFENHTDFDVKRQLVLEACLKFKKYSDVLEEFCKLKDIPGMRNIERALESVDKLDSVTVKNVDLYLESVDVAQKVLNCLLEVNDITTSLKIIFAKLNAKLSVVESLREVKVSPEE